MEWNIWDQAVIVCHLAPHVVYGMCLNEPEKESRKKDCKRHPWFNADALAEKWLKRQIEARYMKSHSEVDKKAYQDARNIYILKLRRAKCSYLNTAVEETQGNQKKIISIIGFPN